ncbi:MAG: M23 family metallopeptidase [Brevinematales bacterium]|nr:M23 family metallopeptidase [Brevinematales bacterium]
MSIQKQLSFINSRIRRRMLCTSIVNYFYGVLPVLYLSISLVFIIISGYIFLSTITVPIDGLSRIVVSRIEVPSSDPIKLKEYMVRKGDTLMNISKKLGVSISTLVSLNKLSSQFLHPGRRLLYSEDDVIRYSNNRRFSVFDVSRRYNVNPYDVFVANGYKFHFDKECLVPGVQLSWRNVSDILGIGFLKPLIGRFTSGFGYRKHPVLGVVRFHSGLDISASYGSPVKASMSGVVEKTGYDEDGYGYYIVIRHQNNMKTLYGHLSKIFVNSGQKVNRGQIIGRVGDTGMTTGPHLHFEVIKNGRRINPKKFILR